MKNVKVSLKAGKTPKIIIEIPVISIVNECANPDWEATHAIAPIKRSKKSKEEFAKYLVEYIDSPTIETSEGDISPLEQMIMDIVQEAYSSAEDFFKLDEDED